MENGPVGSIARETARYEVDRTKCIRCGVSATVAPDLIQLDVDSATFVEQPQSSAEIELVERARFLCPVGAIVREEQ